MTDRLRRLHRELITYPQQPAPMVEMGLVAAVVAAAAAEMLGHAVFVPVVQVVGPMEVPVVQVGREVPGAPVGLAVALPLLFIEIMLIQALP